MKKIAIGIFSIGLSIIASISAQTPTPTPDCSELGVTLELNQTEYHVGDTLNAKIYICNPSSETYSGIPLVVVLNSNPITSNATKYYPSWSSSLDYELIEVPPGLIEKEIISVILPPNVEDISWLFPLGDGDYSFSGLIMDSGMTQLFGKSDNKNFTINCGYSSSTSEFAMTLNVYRDKYGSGSSLTKTSDGGTAIAINRTCILKFNHFYQLQWSHLLSGGVDGQLIRQMNNGEYMLASYFPAISKLDNMGHVQWARKFKNSSNPIFTDSQWTNDEGLIFTGYIDFFDENSKHTAVLLAKISSEGEFQWSYKWCHIADWDPDYYWDIRGVKVIQTIDDSYIVAGSTVWREHDHEGIATIVCFKFSNSGILQWAREFYSYEGQDIHALSSTCDNGFILACRDFDDYPYFENIFKFDSSGELQWGQRLISSYEIHAVECHETSNGDIVILGDIYGDGNVTDISILKYDSNGGMKWACIAGGSERDEAYAIQDSLNGGYELVGSTSSYGPQFRSALFLKTNENGLIPDCSFVRSDISVSSESHNVAVFPSDQMIFVQSPVVFNIENLSITPSYPSIESTNICKGGDYNCITLGVKLWMPQKFYRPGDVFSCSVLLCNPTADLYYDIRLFVILELGGEYYFAPSFGEFDYYTIDKLNFGQREIVVIPEFIWPDVGVSSSATFYAGMTDVSMTNLLGESDSFTFSW